MLTPSDFGNAELGPERGEELELGFDAGLLDDRMQVEFTWYPPRHEGRDRGATDPPLHRLSWHPVREYR